MTPWLRILRPKQWAKNAFVFAPLFFAHRFLDSPSWYLTCLAALCFLCVASTVYIGNDINDIAEDRRHPVKMRRPLAANEITILQAVLMACLFIAIASFILTLLPHTCAIVALIYASINIAYTLRLKRVAIIDVFIIAFCYVLRVLMGCYALDVIVSPWIILTTFLLALFMGFGKRYHEMGFEDYVKYKRNLQNYNRNLLDHLVTICGGATLITYAMYTAEMSRQIGKVEIVYTVGFVAFGLFRYLQSLYVFNEGGEPENIIFRDRLQLANVAAWLLVTLWIIET